MFLHSIPKICCVADVELSVELASQNVNIIHISSYSGALNYVEFRACQALCHMVQGHAPYPELH